MKSQEENIRSAISGLKLLLQVYETKATPRAPYRAMRYSLSAGIEVLEKQIPKSVEKSGFYDADEVFHVTVGINGVPYDLCPGCKINLCTDGFFGRDKKRMRYCEHCGQRLYWGE